MIIYKKGDIFQGHEDIIAHGCNCVGGYGSGIAYTIAKLYPSAKTEYYKKLYNSGWKLGDVQFVQSNNRIIVNCATQHNYQPRNKIHADYDAIKEVMIKLYNYVKKNEKTIAIPKIGAGLANGDWNIIEEIINNVFTDIDIIVYVL